MSDPIDGYLDELLGRLRGDPTTIRRILTETEAHLRDAVDAGASPTEAIARYGSPGLIAAHHSPTCSVVRELVIVGWLLVSLALVAVGISGALAATMDVAFGPRFVAGDPPGMTYDAARCADLRSYTTETASCAAAAARHHTDEVETYRIAAGVLGAAALTAWWLMRRRTPPGSARLLPRIVVDAVAATAFATGALGLLAQASNGLNIGSAAGVGQWLSGALVATMFGGVFVWRFWHDVHPGVRHG